MSIAERVRKVIAEEGHREVDAGQLDTTFEDLGVDSLDKVCILFGLEKEFGVSIPEDVARQFATVRDVVEHLAGQVEAAAESAAS